MAELARSVGGFPGNLCAMTTVTSPDTLYRIDQLREVKAKVRGLSMEPLWNRVPPSELALDGIDWVIVGGESGTEQRVHPFAVEWAEELRDHCAAKGVAFFLMQLGSAPTRHGNALKLRDSRGGDWSEWDMDLRVREFPAWFHQYRAEEGHAAPGLRRKTSMRRK